MGMILVARVSIIFSLLYAFFSKRFRPFSNPTIASAVTSFMGLADNAGISIWNEEFSAFLH